MNKDPAINPTRRRVLGALAFGSVASIVSPGLVEAKELPIKVYKSPTCGCCNDWITHLEANGFAITEKPFATTGSPTSRQTASQ